MLNSRCFEISLVFTTYKLKKNQLIIFPIRFQPFVVMLVPQIMWKPQP